MEGATVGGVDSRYPPAPTSRDLSSVVSAADRQSGTEFHPFSFSVDFFGGLFGAFFFDSEGRGFFPVLARNRVRCAFGRLVSGGPHSPTTHHFQTESKCPSNPIHIKYFAIEPNK